MIFLAIFCGHLYHYLPLMAESNVILFILSNSALKYCCCTSFALNLHKTTVFSDIKAQKSMLIKSKSSFHKTFCSAFGSPPSFWIDSPAAVCIQSWSPENQTTLIIYEFFLCNQQVKICTFCWKICQRLFDGLVKNADIQGSLTHPNDFGRLLTPPLSSKVENVFKATNVNKVDTDFLSG